MRENFYFTVKRRNFDSKKCSYRSFFPLLEIGFLELHVCSFLCLATKFCKLIFFKKPKHSPFSGSSVLPRDTSSSLWNSVLAYHCYHLGSNDVLNHCVFNWNVTEMVVGTAEASKVKNISPLTELFKCCSRSFSHNFSNTVVGHNQTGCG